MGTIPQELSNFKKNVEPNISSMESTCTDIEDKIQTCLNSRKTAQDSFNSSYNSENKQVVLNRFDNIEKLYNKISASISSDLKKMISESKSVIDIVTELEDINKKIEEQQAIVNKTYEDASIAAREKAAAQDIINTKNTEFDKKSEEAKKKLEALKAMDAELEFVKDFTSTDYLSKIDQLNGGSFERRTYKASNGVEVDYYLWIPNYGEEVEGLPIHMYLHGSGENNGGVLNCGLPKLINDKTLVPEGIVICPQSHGSSFDNAKYQDALVELAGNVADTYNGDRNKISISGHSWGAITGYTMLTRYPEFFSAFMPISGRTYQKLGYTTTKVWAFHGARDSSVDYNSAVKNINTLAGLGVDAHIYTYETEGHGNVQNYTFQREFLNPEGETTTALEWAFRQSRA